MKKIKLILFLISIPIFGQNLKVDLPNKFDYNYWSSVEMKRELDFNDVTLSNNQYWRDKLDTRLNTGKYQKLHWLQLKKVPKKIEESIYDRNNELEYKNIYKFNTNGDVVEKVHYYDLVNGSNTKELVEYDENKNIIEYQKYDLSSYTNNEYELDVKYIFKYNQNNKLESEEKVDDYNKHYTYNNNDKIIKIEKYSYDSSLINEQNNVVDPTIQTVYIENLGSKFLLLYTFNYDIFGNRILEEKIDMTDSDTIFRHTFRYGKNNQLENFTTNEFSIDYKYTKSNLLIEETLTNRETNKIKKANWVYNNRGLLISHRTDDYYFSDIFETIFQYDNKDNIIKKTIYKIPSFGEKQLYSVTEMKYDTKNHLIETIHTQDGKWIETYVYDNLGRLLNYKRSKEGNNKFFSDDKYVYDEYGGIIENKWNTLIKRKIEYY